ncbi:hypothetical protein PV327_003043 [Microctonus hyperodae]|uniref:Major facilitator superfamily (MFS) profile domain-containing protein n=1 Tax=Microctonus hyperodae TaxID=165561 RepID=A0AA39L0M9_MICHY|nr:hypothetical protein PV327_003043 [Microctonus hyperodae]
MSRLYQAAIASYIGTLSASIGYGWSSSALILYKQQDSPVKINDDEGGWIASIFMAGCAVGPFLSLIFSHLAGRKTIMMVAALPWIIGWLSIAFATDVRVLYISRFISGIGSGVAFAVTPMYLGEIAPAKIRGILLTMIMTSSRFGILYAYTLIPFISIKVSSIISTVISIAFVLYFSWLPESPYYLLRRGNYNAAGRSLSQLRGKNQDDISEELLIIEASVKNEIASSDSHTLKIIFQSSHLKLLTIGVMLGLFQQLSGSQAIMMYTQTIFDDMNVNLDGKYLAMILGVVQILSLGLCSVLVDRYGRRPLLLLSATGSCIATGIVAIYFNLRWMNVDIMGLEWLPALGCMLYVVFYSLGLAPLPTTMIGELFPTNVKPLCCAIVVFFANTAGFAVGKTYQLVSDSVGTHVAFWIFTILNICAITYVYLFVPETKGKTLQELQKELHAEGK